MTRQLDSSRFRLVVEGPAANPTELTVENAVADGDLIEKPTRTLISGADFSQSLNDIWNGTIAATKESEGLE